MNIRTVTETVHHLQGDDLEDFIEKEYGKRPDFIGTGDIPGDDSSGFYECDVDPKNKWQNAGNSKTELENWAKGKGYGGTSLIRAALTVEADKGNVPTGSYRVHFCWG